MADSPAAAACPGPPPAALEGSLRLEWERTWASLQQAMLDHRMEQERLLARMSAEVAAARRAGVEGAPSTAEQPPPPAQQAVDSSGVDITGPTPTHTEPPRQPCVDEGRAEMHGEESGGGEAGASCAAPSGQLAAAGGERAHQHDGIMGGDSATTFALSVVGGESRSKFSRVSARNILQWEFLTGMDVEDILVMRKRLLREGGFGNKTLVHLIDAFLWWEQIVEPKRNGKLACCLESAPWKLIVSIMIACNSIIMGITTNMAVENLLGVGEATSTSLYDVEGVFLAFFSLELVLRLVVHRLYFFVNDDCRWNFFDFLIVGISVYDVVLSLPGCSNMSFMRSARVLRLSRTLRMVRIFRYTSSLRRMLFSVLGSFVSWFWAFVLLVFVFYLFGIATVQGVVTFLESEAGESAPDSLKENVAKYFGSVSQAMMSYHMATSGGMDWSVYYEVLCEVSLLSGALFVFVCAFTQIALLNIITGVFVESAMKIAQPDRQAMALEQRADDMKDAEELRQLLDDCCTRNTITFEQFKELAEEPRVSSVLEVMGLDIKDATLVFRMLTDAAGVQDIELDFLVEAFLKMKGSATSLDLQTLTYRILQLDQRLDEVFKKFNKRTIVGL